MPVPDIRIAPDQRAWAQDTAALLHQLSLPILTARPRLLLTLSGGATPRLLYQALAAPPWNKTFDWSRIWFLFGDERCIPPDHPDSNYGMAKQALFDPLGISSAQVHRIEGERLNPESAASQYESVIRNLTHCAEPALPHLDVILLGLGEDGHTASLFPGTAALHDHTHVVTVGRSPHGITSRLTMTLGVINQANVVLFLVAGAAKAPIVRRVLEPRSEADRRLPAACVKPDTGRVIWLLDRTAASELTQYH